ncbi:MAG TPA: glycosyl hydrolase [Polyangiaceae bacterium]|jgi:hypothetical protein
MRIALRGVGAALWVGLVACGGGSGDSLAGADGGAGSTSPGQPGQPSSSSDAGGPSTNPPASSKDAGADAHPSGGGSDASVPASDAGGGDAGASTPSRKRGIAYGSHSDADLAALSAGIGWWYNWSPHPDSTLTSASAAAGVEFVPMIWGGTFDPTQLATQVPADAKYLLTFNEPNFGAQSNLTPQQAAALWPKIEAFAQSKNLAIVSPALNYCGGNCNETNPFTWMDAFFAACTGCKVDYVAMHWYACTKSALQSYLSDYESKYTQPLWLTEFSCLDDKSLANDSGEAKYMADALALLEADPRVFRYSWFTGRDTSAAEINLLGATSGTLTSLGQAYVSFPEK